jgi:uncharacterized RDD family membrane protein YckC
MTATGPGRPGFSIDVKPHAYDPAANPELFEGVLARRFLAFLIDLMIIILPVILVAIFIFIAGIVTLGLGFLLYGLLYPAAILWALAYYGLCSARPDSATVGMRVMELELRTWYGTPAYFLLGAVRAVIFWVSVSALTPLILFVGLIDERRRLLHDFLCGTVVINNAARAATLRTAWSHPVNPAN